MIIDIFSDFLCPWCFLGEHRLRRVLDSVDADIEVRFRAFQLRAGLPEEGLDRRAVLAQRYGAAADPARVPARLAETAREEGLTLNYAAMERIPNTLPAHRLMAALQEQNKRVEDRWALADRLFRAYFQDGVDISKRDWLLGEAEAVGLAQPALALEEDGAAAALVTADLVEARDRDVVGVPNLYFAGRFSLPGVQGEDTLRHFLLRAIDRLT